MDSHSVNWKLYELLSSEREKSEISGVIDIGSCGLHVLHGALKTADDATGWNIKRLLNRLLELFNDSPARRSYYLKITGINVYPKVLCVTRWLEDASVAERVTDIWKSVLKIFKF